jgi:hypothetical protein
MTGPHNTSKPTKQHKQLKKKYKNNWLPPKTNSLKPKKRKQTVEHTNNGTLQKWHLCKNGTFAKMAPLKMNGPEKTENKQLKIR